MMLDEAYSVLEKYYLFLEDNFHDGNIEGYDIDTAFTKAGIERVLDNRPQLSAQDRELLQDLYDDGDVGETVSCAIAVILG